MQVNNLARFESILLEVVDLMGRSPQRVLIIGPGACPCCETVRHHLPDAELTLIDIDPESCTYLEWRFKSSTGVIVRCSDAATIDTTKEPPYDLIINRHPNMEFHPVRWKAVFRNMVLMLKPLGILLLTQYDIFEYEAVRETLKNEAVVPISIRQSSRRPVEISGADRYTLVYQNKIQV